MRGPNAKPRTKTETTNVAKVEDEVLNSAITSGIPGANMEDARGLLLVSSAGKLGWDD